MPLKCPYCDDHGRIDGCPSCGKIYVIFDEVADVTPELLERLKKAEKDDRSDS